MEKSKKKFLEYLKYERSYSEKTVLNYDKDLNVFLDFCTSKKINNYKEVDFDFIRSYLKFLYSLTYFDFFCKGRFFSLHLRKNDVK